MMRAFTLWACIVLALAGCTERPDARDHAARIAASAGLRRLDVQAPPFTLAAYARFGLSPMVRIYIEGDGHSWIDRVTPSADPTPWNPVALELAAVDPAPSVAYLGRPCQYVAPGSDLACRAYFWTNGRYAEPVVTSTNTAIDRLKAMSGAATIELVGFSGGGSIAALVAARRNDVASLRTVAANLDTETWTFRQKLSPLNGSLNPADFAAKLANVPQLHVRGAEDRVVDTEVFRSFEARFPRTDCIAYAIIPKAGHGTGWQALWPDLLRRPVRCRP